MNALAFDVGRRVIQCVSCDHTAAWHGEETARLAGWHSKTTELAGTWTRRWTCSAC